MKKTAAWALALALCAALIHAQGEQWNAAAWDQVVTALASDGVNPVPEAYRLALRPGDIHPFDPGERAEGYANILLMSTDAPDIKKNFGRTDALLVCRVNLKTGDTRLLSLPEHALLSLPELPTDVPLRYLNCFGGPLLTLRTLNETLQLSMDRYCAVNLDAFIRIVDALGGVKISLTEGEAVALDVAPGPQTLSGAQALQFVRLRRPGDGSRRVRLVLEALLRQAAEGQGMKNVFSLIDMILPATDTNLTTDDVIDLIFALLGQETPGAFSAQALPAAPDEGLGEGEIRACRAFLYQGEPAKEIEK